MRYSGYNLQKYWTGYSDVNKAKSHKAKARELKAKANAKDFQDSPRPGQGQDQTFPRPGQIKTSDVTYCRVSQLFSNWKLHNVL